MAVDPITAFTVFTEERRNCGGSGGRSTSGPTVVAWSKSGASRVWVGGSSRSWTTVRAGVLERAASRWGAGRPAGVGEHSRRRPDRGPLRASRRRDARDGRARRAGRWGRQGRHGVESRGPELVRRLVRRSGSTCRTSRSTSPGCRSASTTHARRQPRDGLPTSSASSPSRATSPRDQDPLPEGEYGHPWIEFRIGNAMLNVFKLES